MNVLEEVLATRSDEEIIELYQQFKQNWNSSSACQLRAAYILHHYFISNHMSDTLKFFIQEEYDDIHSTKINHKGKDGSRQVFYSTINTYLTFKVQKSLKRYTKKQLYRNMEAGRVKEEFMFKLNYFFRLFKFFLNAFFTHGFEYTLDNDSYVEVLIYGENSNPILAGITNAYSDEEILNQIYDSLINEYNLFVSEYDTEDKKNSSEAYPHKKNMIRNSLIILSIVFLANEKFLEFNLLIAKSILLTEQNEEMYWLLKFLEKEFASKVTV